MTQRFTFPISGAFANCCIGNVNYLLNVENQPTFFTFKDINLSTDFQNLMIEVEDDTCSEKEIHQYLEKSLAGSNYKLCNEHARKYWLRGFVGLGIGALTLLLSCFACHFLWIKIAIAFFSIPVTCFLGIESFRDAKVEMHRKVLSMDILFLLSTFSAILISCMALFIPAFPMMFEAGLLMFGFRHIGTAIKMSVYETAAAPVQYERLVRNTLFKRLQQDKEELVPMGQLLPGDIIVLEKDALVPLDGWLWAEAHETILMDVSRKEGTFTPKKCVNNTPITAGMSSQIRTKMQIGFGHTLKFFTCQPSQNCPAGEIWIYPKHNTIHIHTYSDRDGKPIEFFLDDASLIDGHGKDFKPDIIDQLLSPTNALQHQHTRIHLADAAYQQLSRAIVRHAKKYGLTQTRSYLREISKELEKPMVQSKQRTESAHFFVQVVMAIALISGIIVGCLYAPLMGVRCMMAILVSVCPCAYGSIEPLVMYYARKRAEELHIILSHSDALSGLAKVDVIALDYHGTVTQGKPQIEIHYTEGGDQKDIDTKLAFIEHGSQHYIGKAIYEKIKGNQLLSHGDFPKLTLTEYHGGMEAVIGDQTYIVGNQHCLQRFGVTPKVVKPGMIYFLVKHNDTYSELATIEMQDPLRSETREVIRQLQQRGYKVRGLTGADVLTFTGDLSDCLLEAVYRNCPPIDEYHNGEIKKGKGTLIAEWQARGEHVLMVGDGMNDSAAFKAAYVSIMMTHEASDEGLRYQAKARILNNNLQGVVRALDLAHQSMWMIKLNILFSLMYNLLTVLLTNMALLCCGIMVHPGLCAALMAVQMGFIILNTRQHIQQNPLPEAKILGRVGVFGSFLNHCTAPFVSPMASLSATY